MKYIKFTYVDAVTGVSVIDAPAGNGPTFPNVVGLEYVWARESRYPTDTPEFFGTCPEGSNTDEPGVLGSYLQSDWEQMQADEMRARNPVPQSVTMRQARLALLGAGLLDDVEAAIAGAGPAAKIEWDYAAEVQRSSGLVPAMAVALGMTDEQIDALFIDAEKL